MRFDEPEPLVDAARHFGEDVHAVRILEVIELVDRLARLSAELREHVGQRAHVLVARRDHERILTERRPLADDAHRALGNAAELHDTLGDEVDVLLDRLVDLVEQLVQPDEVRAFHVPVCLLVCDCRSMQSASRWFSSSTAGARVSAGNGFFVS